MPFWGIGAAPLLPLADAPNTWGRGLRGSIHVCSYAVPSFAATGCLGVGLLVSRERESEWGRLPGRKLGTCLLWLHVAPPPQVLSVLGGKMGVGRGVESICSFCWLHILLGSQKSPRCLFS